MRWLAPCENVGPSQLRGVALSQQVHPFDGASAPVAETDAVSAARTLPVSTLLAYCAPMLGAGFMFLLLPIYLTKFATDVLLISPAVMGVIFFVSRLWDAFVDPVTGYLSDRTRSRLGRRRPWMLASIVPVSLAYLMAWAPPEALAGHALEAWMAVAVFCFYTATTLLVIPHQALGAELTPSYHDRTRLFGWRHAAWSLGGVLALGAMALFTSEVQAQRTIAFEQAVAGSLLTAIGTLIAIAALRERGQARVRRESNPWVAYRDVLHNPHARLILFVFLIESIGSATIAALTPFVGAYVVGRPELTPVFIVCYYVPTLVSVPLWVWLSSRHGKKSLWLFSMWVTAFSFGALFFLERDSIALIVGVAVIAGVAAGCGAVVGPSVQADCIDWDEYVTGERKEGAYFAAWTFMLKTAFGFTSLWTGLALGLSGYVPNAEQNETTLLVLRVLYSIVPLVCFTVGALMFTRFGLGQLQHAEIRRALDERAAQRRG